VILPGRSHRRRNGFVSQNRREKLKDEIALDRIPAQLGHPGASPIRIRLGRAEARRRLPAAKEARRATLMLAREWFSRRCG